MQEIDGKDASGLGGEELSPTRSAASRCGWQAGVDQDSAHRRGAQAVAEA